jgi:hypothetical protein
MLRSHDPKPVILLLAAIMMLLEYAELGTEPAKAVVARSKS